MDIKEIQTGDWQGICKRYVEILQGVGFRKLTKTEEREALGAKDINKLNIWLWNNYDKHSWMKNPWMKTGSGKGKGTAEKFKISGNHITYPKHILAKDVGGYGMPSNIKKVHDVINKNETFTLDFSNCWGGTMVYYLFSVEQLLPLGKLFEMKQRDEWLIVEKLERKVYRTTFDVKPEDVKNFTYGEPPKRRHFKIIMSKETASAGEILPLILSQWHDVEWVFQDEQTNGFVSTAKQFSDMSGFQFIITIAQKLKGKNGKMYGPTIKRSDFVK